MYEMRSAPCNSVLDPHWHLRSFAITLSSAFLAAHFPPFTKSLVLDKPSSVHLKDSAEHKTLTRGLESEVVVTMV